MQTCELLGLAECVVLSDSPHICVYSYSRNVGSLATGNENVQRRLKAYATDLRSLGVDGFRLDAAKRNDVPLVFVYKM